MGRNKLELVREEKLFRLLPGRSEKSRLEASGVALLDDATALVVFDNLNQVARIDLSLKRRRTNGLFPAPSLGAGFEDIAIDRRQGRFLCLVESVEDFDGIHRSFVAEYDSEGHFLACTRLPSRLRKANKGFEGLAHEWLGSREYLYALSEGNVGPSGQRGGQIEVFLRDASGWKASRRIRLPKQANFDDYAALAYRDGQVAIVSQESARLWVARLDRKARGVVPGSEAVYRFPSKSYGNVEGIAWLSRDTLVAVSDRRKRDQPERCSAKDQAIHVFRIPAE
ncbi:MAG TPA: esterase-like activity of phytase family protein [Pirellulaceae bacterium]|nr:esterase-like activity of phytase family protein [Pirellulaceae bacterium]